MAFVFKAEKKDPDAIQAALPGPGQYRGQDAYTFTENRIGFHSSTSKEQTKPTHDPELGPGSYNITKDLLAADKTQNVFFMPADPDKEEVEQVRATNVFKSKTKRFENNGGNENPGPDTYNPGLNSGKKKNFPKPSSKLKVVQDMLKEGKTMIPSIPSNVHSYGYTENDESALVLNQDPLAQAQQYVGPGYYEVKENPQGSKYKGPSWHKSGVKKLESFAKNTATAQTVGPGTYEAPEPTVQGFKDKPNAGFASTTTRSFDAYVKMKLGQAKLGKTPLSSQSEIGGRRLSAAETDIEDEDDEYLKEATPGPGYYYNESMLSSFSTKNSEYSSTGSRGGGKQRLNGFGRTQRFKDQQAPTTKDIGPGDYDVKLYGIRKDPRAKVPFQSSNTRFERALVPLQPGPGTYNPPLMLVDRVTDKAKSGYVGSFGITEKRFKISKLLEETPGPGTYIQDNQKSYVEDITAAFRKGSYYFTSTSQRKAFVGKNDSTAAPGSYNLNHFNIATKVSRNDDDLELPRNEPFSYGPERFPKPKERVIVEDEDEDDEDDEPRFGATRNFDSLLKPKTKQKANAVFASSTKRTVPGQKKGPNPGPGSYYDSNQNMWNKRTFNIHFTGD